MKNTKQNRKNPKAKQSQSVLTGTKYFFSVTVFKLLTQQLAFKKNNYLKLTG